MMKLTGISDEAGASIEKMKTALRNAEILGTRQMRIMSYPNGGLADDSWHAEALRRVRYLGEMAADTGVTLLLENCSGWAASTPERFAAFFEELKTPSIRAVYDTGNPASHHAGEARVKDWFDAAKPYISHVHIKDHTGRAENVNPTHLWPGEGVCRVRETLEELACSGYDGFLSIEPHMGIAAGYTSRFTTYVEYGRRLQHLLSPIREPGVDPM